MHFAAFSYVGESVTNPGKYYRSNVAVTLRLLEVIRDVGVKQFMFSSACTTHGVLSCVRTPEDQPQNPIIAYGASNLIKEPMMHEFDTTYGLRSISLRNLSASGADPACEICEAHDPETHLTPPVHSKTSTFLTLITHSRLLLLA
jgi:UDP-glucose 4-epimerase